MIIMTCMSFSVQLCAILKVNHRTSFYRTEDNETKLLLTTYRVILVFIPKLKIYDQLKMMHLAWLCLPIQPHEHGLPSLSRL